jgi:hypothetical protein
MGTIIAMYWKGIERSKWPAISFRPISSNQVSRGKTFYRPIFQVGNYKLRTLMMMITDTKNRSSNPYSIPSTYSIASASADQHPP